MKKLLFILILLCSFQGFGQIKGYWRLDGNSNDASGNGNNGTDTNITYSQANGRLNQGAGFNGTSSKIVTVSNIGITSDAQLTVSLWLNLSADNNLRSIINTGVNDVLKSFGIFTGFNGVGSIAVAYAGANTIYTGSNLYLENTWNNIVVTKSTGVIGNTKIYLNSKLQTTYQEGSGTPNITNTKMTIGYGAAYGGYYFLGSIDQIIYDNTVWSPAKVKNEYTRVKGQFQN